MNIDSNGVWGSLQALRRSCPLIHNITNVVSAEFTANVLLAAGSSPVMTTSSKDSYQMANRANALVINMGTPDEQWQRAVASSIKASIPKVFDPVGAGATPYRLVLAKKIIHTPLTAIRGNASEIAALADDCSYPTKGVEATRSSLDCLKHACRLANQRQTIVIISGDVDVVTNGKQHCLVHHGSPLMSKVTGMGCAATALVGAFLSVVQDPFVASIYAMVVMGLAGEKAAKQTASPGSFKMAFIDALYELSYGDTRCVDVEWI